jgi:hypothetical protein
MHIPRGCWHQATREDRGDGFSLHATFGFPKRTGVDWVSWLADQARATEVLRHDIDRWGTADDQGEQQLTFVDKAVLLAASQSTAEFLASHEHQRPPARHVQTHGLFGEPAAVVCISEFPPHVQAQDGKVIVAASGKTITFAAAARPVLDLLLSGRPVTISDTVAIAGDMAAVVARVLVEEAICAELTPELAAGYDGLVTPQGR